MNNELLPCPFCGSEAKTEMAYYDYERFWVECVTCKASNYAPNYEEQAESITAWNRRFVCLDKNGDKVFAGDKLTLIAKEAGKHDEPLESLITLEPCISQDGVDMSLRYIEAEAVKAGATIEIALIKENNK